MGTYLTIADICRRLNISFRTAKQVVNGLPRVKIGGRFKYSEQDLQNALKASIGAAVAEGAR